MGEPMTANLVTAGHHVVVWNPTAAKAEEFAAKHGAAVAADPQSVARTAEFVVTVVADDSALLELYRRDNGILSRLRPVSVAIDMGTVSPDTIRALHAEIAAAGCQFLDAPVSVSVAAATAATLTVMAAGEEHAFAKARHVLTDMGDPVL
jgi:3-hydroxyisobutyrate dehydrogenase-like beta-hydroxyacid dehydrogenase